VGNASAPVVEQIGHLDLTVNALCGANALNIVSAPNQDFTLSLTNILLGRYAEIDFNPQPQGSATVKIATTNPGGELTNGVLRYNTATYKQSTWAIVADGIVTGMPDAAYITDFDAGDLNSHLDVAGVVNVGGSTAMTMRFKSPAPTTLTIAAGKTVLTADGNKNNGAILVAPGAGQVDINGGTIDFGANTVFHIHQFNTNAPLVIAACLGGSNNPGVSKCGPGEVILTNRTNAAGGSNGGYQIHEGIVTVDSIASNGVASSLGRGSANYPIKLGNATLRYIGEGHASDRAFSLLGDGTIEASGAGVLHFTSNGYFMTQASGGDNFITLAGTGTGIVDGAFILRAGAIVKNGPGVWILNSTNNTYYSDTVIKQGSLVVNGSIFYSDCVIKDGALRGTGDWNAAALYVESGGTIAPGASVGTLTFDEVNLAPGSVFEWDVDAGNSSADTLVSRERLNLPDAPNSVTVKVVQVGAASAGTYPLFAFTMLTGDTNALVIDTSGSGYGQPSLAVTGQGISVGMVPEPAMLLGALLGLWAVCRRG
jgi:autotransporter-associated beta strand protein